MKQIITIALILISVNCFSQKKDSVIATKADTTYQLTGTMQEFVALYTAVISPDDITPNQRKYLAAWIQKLKALPPPKPK